MEENRPRRFESYRTTGEFEQLDRGYRNHCGPTALTNLVLTLFDRAGQPPAEPKAVFRRAAGLGMRRLFYGNFNLLGRWGGTSDLLSPAYLRAVLRTFGLADARVGLRRRLNEKTLERAAAQGEILYLQTRRHPRYGYHHLLCYGAARDPEGGEWQLRLADGWTGRPVVVPLSAMPRCHFVPILPEGQKKE